MERIIYVKYNSMRKPEYRITTEVHENGREKWVVKRPGDGRAEQHLSRIAMNRELLAKKAYSDISVLEVKKEDDGLRFPFIHGTVLADKVDHSRLDKETFVAQVNELFDQIMKVREECRCPFAPAEGFVSWFGEMYPEEGAPAVCPANLDSILSNFIESENGLVCIDYEWVFDFPVPVDFIKYRCIRYFYNERMNSLFYGVSRDTVMEWFGFDQGKQDLFWNMESHFQQLIYGKDWKYLYLNKYKKNERTIQMLDDTIAAQNRIVQEKETCIQEQEACIKEKEACIQEKDACIKEKEASIRETEARIQEKDAYIRNQEEQINQQKEEIEKQNKVVDELNQEIIQMKMRINDLESTCDEYIHSTSWKITKPLRTIGTFARKLKK